MRAVGSSQNTISSLAIVDVPEAPLGAGVRVKVIAACLNAADVKTVEREFAGRVLHAMTKPLVPGYDFSGVVTEVGPGTGFIVGDEVFGHLAYAGSTTQGSCAQSVVVAKDTIAKKPAGVSHATAAGAATVGLTALQLLRDKGGLVAGQRLLVLGAAGGVGLLAVGIGKRLGAHVTGVCSDYAVDDVKAAGADVVVDRAKTDPFAGGPYDVILDTTGTYAWGKASAALTPAGVMVTTLPGPALVLGTLAGLVSKKRCRWAGVRSTTADLQQLGAWLADGLSVRIAEHVPLADTARGLQRLKSGRLVGRIVIDIT